MALEYTPIVSSFLLECCSKIALKLTIYERNASRDRVAWRGPGSSGLIMRLEPDSSAILGVGRVQAGSLCDSNPARPRF
jgi:hypothetical protein